MFEIPITRFALDSSSILNDSRWSISEIQEGETKSYTSFEQVIFGKSVSFDLRE